MAVDPKDIEKTYLHTIHILQERIHILEEQLQQGMLFGQDEIRAALKNMSEYKFKKWIKRGMPVLIVDGTCYAHRDNLNNFFKSATCVNSSKVPEENMEGGE